MCLCLHRSLALIHKNSKLSVKIYSKREYYFVVDDVAIFASKKNAFL